jgi:hypothetical protein
MLNVSKKFSRFAVALGGFLIFLGIIVMAVFVVGSLGMIDFTIIEGENIQSVLVLMLLAIGIIDLVAGVILWKR